MKKTGHTLLFWLLSLGALQASEFDNWYFEYIAKPCVYECKKYLLKDSGRELAVTRTGTSDCRLSTDGKAFIESWTLSKDSSDEETVSDIRWIKVEDGEFHSMEVSPEGVKMQSTLTINPDKTGTQDALYDARFVTLAKFTFTEEEGIIGTAEVRTISGKLIMEEEFSIKRIKQQ